jgi:hypothetical protein
VAPNGLGRAVLRLYLREKEALGRVVLLPEPNEVSEKGPPGREKKSQEGFT